MGETGQNGKMYWKYWGKARQEDDAGAPYHLLVYHSLDVAAVASVMLECNTNLRKKLATLTGLDENSLAKWAVFFLALHDIGKFSDSFQNLVPEVLNKFRTPDLMTRNQ